MVWPTRSPSLFWKRRARLLERTEAVRTALSLGMSLQEIEDYLDWLDNMRSATEAEPNCDPETRRGLMLPAACNRNILLRLRRTSFPLIVQGTRGLPRGASFDDFQNSRANIIGPRCDVLCDVASAGRSGPTPR